MAKKAKVDTKGIAKVDVATIVLNALTEAGVNFSDGKDVYGQKANSIVVHDEKHDVRIDFTTPKAGLDRYEIPVEDEAEDAE